MLKISLFFLFNQISNGVHTLIITQIKEKPYFEDMVFLSCYKKFSPR